MQETEKKIKSKSTKISKDIFYERNKTNLAKSMK